MTTNTYICRVLDRFDSFMGVFPADIHPKLPRIKNGFLSAIFNTKLSYETGIGHWVLISYFCYNEVLFFCEVFEPLGFNNDVLPRVIKEYIRGLNVRVKYTTREIQSINSNFCGFFCIARFLSIYYDEKLSTFLNKFNKSPLITNDDKCVKLIQIYINKINETFV